MRAATPLTILAIAIALAGCAGAAKQAPLAGSEWQPTRLGASSVPNKPESYVQFRVQGRLAGLGGCNRFMGGYTLDGDKIAIGPLASTQMACPEPAMTQERAFVSALQAAKTYKRGKEVLTLYGADGKEIAQLTQRDRD
ncbi:MAG: META domain-containing protein [Alphaproteobacteria bacterium]|nr:META domain-containing protein [Alphaproteobacteria bacterium]